MKNTPLNKEELEELLNSIYQFSVIKFTKSNEMNLHFEFKTINGVSGELKIIKATRRIAFKRNGDWIFDKKHMLNKEIIF